MREDEKTGEVNTTGEHPLSGLANKYDLNADIDEYVIYDLPSPHMTPKKMLELAKKINEVISGYTGIVITHGTDTLEETAYFLDLVLETKKPVILTGAMRSSNELGSDALYNLISSLRVALDDHAVNKGVLVVMNGEIHTAAKVTKSSTTNLAAFKTPQYGPIGVIMKDSIIFHHTAVKSDCYPITEIASKVFLLKAFAGLDEDMIHAMFEAKPDGIVIEAFGQGNLPAAAVKPLQQIINEEIPVVIVSRCYEGYVHPTYAYEGGGKQLKDSGVIFGYGLTGPKARIKLMIALEKTNDLEELKKIFHN